MSTPLSCPVLKTDTGSSPLARGLLIFFQLSRKSNRIIPARAGFTVVMIGFMVVSPDHPRSRGVYMAPFEERPGWWGSSPLARGLQEPVGVTGRPRRIIPARAGFTWRHPPGL